MKIGKSTIIYQASVVPYVLGSKTKNFAFTLSGFQTKSELLVKLNQNIDSLKVEDVTNHPTKKQDVNLGNIPTSKDINLPSKEGHIFTFKLASHVDDGGISLVTYTVIKNRIEGVKSKDIKFKVSDFQTKIQADAKAKEVEEANKRIANLEIYDINPPTVKNKDYYSEDNFNPPVKEGFSFKYKNTSYKDWANNLIDGVAYVAYEVDVLPNIEGTKTKEIKFKVSGFTVLKDDLKLLYGIGKVIPPVAKKILSYKSTPKENDLFSPFFSGFTFTFVSATPIDDDGDSEIKYWKKDKKNDESKEIVIFTVSGFQTKVKFDGNTKQTIKKLNDKIQAVTKKTLEKLPRIVWKANEDNNWVDDIEAPVQKGFKFKLIKQKTFYSSIFIEYIRKTEHGYLQRMHFLCYISFDVSIDYKEVAKKRLVFKIHSKSAQEYYDRKIKKYDLELVTPPTIKSKVLKNGKLSNTNFNDSEYNKKIIYFHFISATPINEKGESIVTYKFTPSRWLFSDFDQEIKFTVSGFHK